MIGVSGNINGGAQIFVNWFGLPLWLAQVIYYVIAGIVRDEYLLMLNKDTLDTCMDLSLIHILDCFCGVWACDYDRSER